MLSFHTTCLILAANSKESGTAVNRARTPSGRDDMAYGISAVYLKGFDTCCRNLIGTSSSYRSPGAVQAVLQVEM